MGTGGGSHPAAGAKVGLTETNRDLGVITFNYLRNPDLWIHRRVECVSLGHSTLQERRVSLDFTIQPDAKAAVFSNAMHGDLQDAGDAGTNRDVLRPIHFVPLGLFKKRPLVGFSVEDETGKSLPILTKARNTALAASVLVAVAESYADSDTFGSAELPVSVERDLWRIAGGNPLSLSEIRDLIGVDPHDGSRRWREELTTTAAFLEHTERLSRAFILAVPLQGGDGARRIVKFQYEEHGDQPRVSFPEGLQKAVDWVAEWVSGPPEFEARGIVQRDWKTWLERAIGRKPMAVEVDVANMAHGGTYHLEVIAPEGLQITYADLGPPDLNQPRAVTIRQSLQRVHLYLDSTVDAGYANIALRPRPMTIIRTACIVSVLSLALLVFAAFNAGEFESNPSIALSLLLVAPAGLAAYIARGTESLATTEAVFGLRILAAASGIWPFLSGVLFSSASCEQPVVKNGDRFIPTPSCEIIGGEVGLWVVVGLALLNLYLLVVYLGRVYRPPEQVT